MPGLDIIIEELKELLEKGDEISPKVARKLQLAISLDTHMEVKKINGRLKKVEAVTKTAEDYPSLLWLLRFKTKKTVATIVVVFVVLSILYVSGLRESIFAWLGLPSLIP